MANERILLVDDQPEILEPVQRKLESEGYQIITAHDGPSAIEKFMEESPDMVVLDLMLPKLDGLVVCKRIRGRSDVPILMLSAKFEETDIIVGLELGADDYVTKPFRVNELVARIRALLRRPPLSDSHSMVTGGEVLKAGGVSLDTTRHQVTVDGRQVALTPVEFRLMTEFLKRPGQVLTREALLEAVWGYDGYDPSLVNTHVKRLRAKVEKDPSEPERVVSVRGVGYKFLPEASE